MTAINVTCNIYHTKRLLNEKQENFFIKIKKEYKNKQEININDYHLKKRRNDKNIIKNGY